MSIAARIHIGKDGAITVMTGKVEGGQGARTELTQAAAEELGLPPDRVRLVMGDTDLVPDDGITAGSGSTPRTMPAVRQGAAAARALLVAFAARQWGVDPGAGGSPRRQGRPCRHAARDDLRRPRRRRRAGQGAPAARSRRRRPDARQGVEGARPVGPPAERARHRHRRPPLPLGHGAARNALRQVCSGRPPTARS